MLVCLSDHILTQQSAIRNPIEIELLITQRIGHKVDIGGILAGIKSIGIYPMGLHALVTHFDPVRISIFFLLFGHSNIVSIQLWTG
ncbi:MAG: hypothetical protein DCF23_12105 [Cyanobium sp.]|nr:MAG: hypothetical protein DCF23_12105 [Cyanobium sp.]